MTPWATIRFHAVAGARVALRNSALGTAVVVFIIGMSPEPVVLLQALASSIAERGVPPWASVLLAVPGIVLARQARPQVAAGREGWARSLPVSSRTQQGAAVVALVLTQAPVLLFAVGCAIAIAILPEQDLGVLKVLAVLPGVGVTATIASWGPWRVRRRRQWYGDNHVTFRISRRAVSWRLVPAILPAALPLAFAWFFRRNNGDLPGPDALMAAQLGGTLGVTIALAGLANLLQARRPAWIWSRSLPWSARQRVVHDATFMSIGLLPVLVAVALMDIRALLRVALIVPLLSLIAAAAMRRAGWRLTASAGEPFLLGICLAFTGAVWPWTIAVAAAATPLALLVASGRERRAQASRWMERHHSNVGDPLSWTGR